MALRKAQTVWWPALWGAIYALSFAPGPLPSWSLAWLQLIALAFLCHFALKTNRPRQAALTGLTFGFTSFCVGLYWLTISMHVYGHLALPLAWLALMAFAIYLSLYPALACAISHFLCSPLSLANPLRIIWYSSIWAAAWTGAELLRGQVFTGFPWLATAYGQVEGWISGWSVLTGSPGVTFITAWIAAAVALTLKAETGAKVGSFTPRRGLALALAIVLAFIGAFLQQTPFATPTGTPIIVRLVQGNVDQAMKFDANIYEQVHRHYLDLASHRKTAKPEQSSRNPDLIVLPETVITRLSHRVPYQQWQDWISLAKNEHATVMLGVAVYDSKSHRYTNSVLAIDGRETPVSLAQGIASGRYDKHHLVPFGEYVPRGFRWFIDMMQIPLGDFNRGSTDQIPITIDSQRIAANICYEDIFGNELRSSVLKGATVLANFSNLGWFGDSWALRQHWQMARLRAMETRRPMLRSTNTGITGALDQYGEVVAQIPALVAGYVDVQIQGYQAMTPYVRWGDLPTVVFVLILLAIAVATRHRRNTSPDD